MAFEVPGDKLGQLSAAADLSTKQYCFVIVSGALLANTSGAGGDAIGVLQNKPTSGQACEIMTSGVTKVVAGAAVAAGAKVMSDAAGKGITAATTGSKVQGIALEAAGASGDIIAVQLKTLGQIP